MTGLDTNVLVRYVVRDDPAQTRLADEFIDNKCTVESPGYVAHIVLCELVWELTSGYQYDKVQALSVIEQMLRVKQLTVQSPQTVALALADATDGKADFSDYLLARSNQVQGCDRTATFDKKAAKHPHFLLLATR